MERLQEEAAENGILNCEEGGRERRRFALATYEEISLLRQLENTKPRRIGLEV